MKKSIIAVVIVIIAVAVAAAIIFPARNPIVMEIEGIKVPKEEFELAISEKIAEAYNHFFQKYGVEDSEDFWKTDFEGITPEEYVKTLAKDYLIDKKCRMKIMLDNGLITDAGYDSFKKELRKVNVERQRIKDSGGVIYGPVQYSQKEYDIYLMSNREIELKRQLETLRCSEEEIQKYYNDNKDTLYKIQDTVTIEANGQTMEFTPELARHDSTSYPEIYEAAYELEEGSECQINLADGETVNIKCISRKDNGYMSMDEAYDSAKSALEDEKYNKLIESVRANADVKLNEKEYKKITID